MRQAGSQSNDNLPLFAVNGNLTGACWAHWVKRLDLMDHFPFEKFMWALAQFSLRRLYIKIVFMQKPYLLIPKEKV